MQAVLNITESFRILSSSEMENFYLHLLSVTADWPNVFQVKCLRYVSVISDLQ